MLKFDLTGKIFGRLTVLKLLNSRSNWLCKCACGSLTKVYSGNLRSGDIKSCGCLKKETKSNLRHGKRNDPIYSVWSNLITRCTNKKVSGYKDYGGRGIKCMWGSFEEFCQDMSPSYEKHVKHFGRKETQLDRINNNGNYCKENCKWSTKSEQMLNRRNNVFLTKDGKTQTIAEWARELDVSFSVIEARLNRYKWPVDRVLIPLTR